MKDINFFGFECDYTCRTSLFLFSFVTQKNYQKNSLSAEIPSYLRHAENISHWVMAKFLVLEKRHSLLVHDYQQTEIQQLRSMKNTKPADSIEQLLKSLSDVLTTTKSCQVV